MKPPVTHQSVQPPLGRADASCDLDGAMQPPDDTAADDGRDVRIQSTTGRKPGLVGDFGPLVGTTATDVERRRG